MSKTEQAVIIPSDPAVREELKRAIMDVSGQMTIAEGHKSVIKEGIDGIAEKFELPKKFIRKMARSYHMQNFDNQKSEFADFEELYEKVIEGVPSDEEK